MHIFYKDKSGFNTGRILSKTDSSVYIETGLGKKIRIKNCNILFRFETSNAYLFLKKARELAKEFDLQLLWDSAPKEIFEASTLAVQYFGHSPNPIELASLIICLSNSGAYFYKRDKGKYCAASREILTQALHAIEKKKRQQEQQKIWLDYMVNGKLPEAIAKVAESLIVQPDKNSIEWKAVEQACKKLQKKPENLLLSLGAWPNSLVLIKKCFLKKNFPNGIEFPNLPDLVTKNYELPSSNAKIYSIDSISTTEIDDALSVTVLEDRNIKVGIHISAPGLAITRDSKHDRLVRNRLCSIYIPGEKITMQPQSVIEQFSLDEGRQVPALSLYVTVDMNSGGIIQSISKLENIIVTKNLKIEFLEKEITREFLNNKNKVLPYENWIRPLWMLAHVLEKQRALSRGKFKQITREEYEFFLEGNPDSPKTKVHIVSKKRESPISFIIAEFMILANTLWADLLRKNNLPGIYRSQRLGKTHMSVEPLPHEGVGAPQYIWSTSPLRRYVDLVNQWQLISAIQYGVSAHLLAPFKSCEDEDLFRIIETFNIQYSHRSNFQNTMERYWSLQWLIQNGIRIVNAYILKNGFVKLMNIPVATRVTNLPILSRGDLVQVKILKIDELSLELNCLYLQTISKQPAQKI